MNKLDAYTIIFSAGNAVILVAGIPNYIKLIKTGDVKSFSFCGPIFTWLGLTMFASAYAISGLWLPLVLNLPSTFYWGAVASLKVHKMLGHREEGPMPRFRATWVRTSHVDKRQSSERFQGNKLPPSNSLASRNIGQISKHVYIDPQYY